MSPALTIKVKYLAITEIEWLYYSAIPIIRAFFTSIAVLFTSGLGILASRVLRIAAGQDSLLKATGPSVYIHGYEPKYTLLKKAIIIIMPLSFLLIQLY